MACFWPETPQGVPSNLTQDYLSTDRFLITLGMAGLPFLVRTMIGGDFALVTASDHTTWLPFHHQLDFPPR
jgi:hypothetical protein